MTVARSRGYLGAAAVASSCLLFAANSLVVKVISARVGPWTISLTRFLVGALLASVGLAVWALGRREPLLSRFRVHSWPLLAARAGLGVLQMSLFFLGIALTSAGRCTLLACTHPMFAALFGLLFFGERLPKVLFLGIGLGFAGACVVFWDGSAYSLAGNLVCLAAGMVNGLAMHFVKLSRRDHSPLMVYLAPCLAGTAATVWALPGLLAASGSDGLLLVLVGVLAFTGQIILTWGMKDIPATSASLLGLSEILFAVTLSAAFLGEVMPPGFFLGGALLLAGLAFTGVVLGRRV